MKQSVSVSVNSASSSELRSTLDEILSQHFGSQCRVTGVKSRPSPYRTSFPILELDVDLDDGKSFELILKDTSRQGLSPDVLRAKPGFLYNPLREIETYRSILAPNQLNSPTFYGAVVDHRITRYWLFLEKVKGAELFQVGDFTIWRQVARTLATLHSRCAGQIESLRQAQSANLLCYDANFYWMWLHRAQSFLRGSEAPAPRERCRGIDWLAESYVRVVERLERLPVTFIHGEFYASNVLVEGTVEDLRVCPVDWEMAGLGPGLIDLAALTAGKWAEEQVEALARAYYASLTPDKDWPPAWDRFLDELDYCRLHLAMQWLGWSEDWSPPSEHAHDWLGEAVSIAEKLGL